MNNPQPESPPVATDGPCRPERSCYTNCDLVKLNQQWSIANFKTLVTLCKPGQCLRSQSFSHPSTPDVNWQLCMYPGGKREENKGFISLFLKMYAPPQRDVCITAEYRLFFLADNGERKFLNVNVGEFHSKSGKKGFGWGLRNLPRMKVLSCLRNDGSLLIHCEVDSLPDLSKVQCVDVSSSLSAGPLGTHNPLVNLPRRFSEDMLDLFTTGRMSDFTIKVEGQSFAVHRAILAGRSDVFSAMLSCETMNEATNKTLDITDFSPEAVRQLLLYMYSGRITESELEDHVEELIGLSEKYGICDLKRECERDIADRLSTENVFDAIALADLYLAADLKRACKNVILLNKKECLVSTAWKTMKEKRPQLALEIMEFVAGFEPPKVKEEEPTTDSESGEPSRKRLRLNSLRK